MSAAFCRCSPHEGTVLRCPQGPKADIPIRSVCQGPSVKGRGLCCLDKSPNIPGSLWCYLQNGRSPLAILSKCSLLGSAENAEVVCECVCTSPGMGWRALHTMGEQENQKLALAPLRLHDKATGVRGLRSGREGGRRPHSLHAVCTSCWARMQKAWPEAQAARRFTHGGKSHSKDRWQPGSPHVGGFEICSCFMFQTPSH